MLTRISRCALTGLDGATVEVEVNISGGMAGLTIKGVHYVIELPAGTIARTATQVGDQLLVTF